MHPIIIARKNSEELAARIAEAVGGRVLILSGEALVPGLREAFRTHTPLIALLSVPIVVRALGPLLADKFVEGPVVVVAGDGSTITPLLGLSHGASRLAQTIAATLGLNVAPGTATAALSNHGLSLDDVPPGYALSHPETYKAFALALLEGNPVRLEGHAPWLSHLPQSPDAALSIAVTDTAQTPRPNHLTLATKTLVVGVGCDRHAPPDLVEGLIRDTLAQHTLSWDAIAAFATLDLKEDEPALRALAAHAPVRLFTAAELNALEPCVSSPSEIVRAETGTASVAEAACLAAAGAGATLIVPKAKNARATCAVARSTAPLTHPLGRAPGSLFVIGLGPGGGETLTREAARALGQATDWVGYDLYLDLAAPESCGHETRHPFPLGAEEARVRFAIDLARAGKQVALICSGDPGIYAMAALVFEVLDLEPARIAVEIIPGVSAFQAAAARAGALIGHDFCCISLSDLLTPWETIEKRLRGAAEGDFVVAFYNPRSLKRTDQLARAMALLKPHRAPDTPVVIASNLGRPTEKVHIVALADFDPAQVDMLTLVMVGSSQSRMLVRGDGRTHAYTPRGYAKKREI